MSSTDVEEPSRADRMEAKRALMATQGELLKAQLVAATRLDVIKLLGYIANRQDIPDLSALLPTDGNLRKVFARELRELAADMRVRANGYDNIASSLEHAH
jgi:hypothetical protein